MPIPFDSESPIDPLEGTTLRSDEPGRAVTFQEFRSLVDQVNASIQASEQRRRRIARDRRIGWVLTVVVISLIGWIGVLQFQAGHDLRQSLYETCTNTQQANRDQAHLYQQIIDLSPRKDSPFVVLLGQAVANLSADRQCAAKYL